jgi:hypothetical protein
MTLRPILGDVIHTVSYNTENGEWPASCLAAIITWVHPAEPGDPDPMCDLHVFKPWGFDIRPNVTHDDGEPAEDPTGLMCRGRDYPPGTWHWGDSHDDPQPDP